MKRLIAIIIGVVLSFGLFSIAPANAAEEQFNGWVTWEIPNGGTGTDVKYPQPFVGLGIIAATKCGVTNQHDRYEGPKKSVEQMWVDHLLQHGEDQSYVKEWKFTTGKCDVEVTRSFQVDTLHNPTTKLAKKAAGYDNDGKLKWGEDKAHYGHSAYQTVKVNGLTSWTSEQWITAINKATTKKGVGNVSSLSHKGKLKKGQILTTAWQTHGKWKTHAQTFFAQGVQ